MISIISDYTSTKQMTCLEESEQYEGLKYDTDFLNTILYLFLIFKITFLNKYNIYLSESIINMWNYLHLYLYFVNLT